MDKEIEIMFKYENEILDIIDNVADFTRSDLQGCIEAQLLMLIREVKGEIIQQIPINKLGGDFRSIIK